MKKIVVFRSVDKPPDTHHIAIYGELANPEDHGVFFGHINIRAEIVKTLIFSTLKDAHFNSKRWAIKTLKTAYPKARKISVKPRSANSRAEFLIED